MKKVNGVALAMAAAGLFATVPLAASASGEETKIDCAGVNACRGKSDCKGATDGCKAPNECKGLNECKGQGFVSMSKETCEQLGGKVER